METASEVLEYGYAAVLLALTGAALARWRRGGGDAARWVALTFGSLGVVTAMLTLLPDEASGTAAGWVRKAAAAGLVLFPYLLFRFVATFAPRRQVLDRAAVAVTGAAALLVLVLPEIHLGDARITVWAVVFLLALGAQWLVLSSVAAVRLWRAGAGQPTVPRRRMRLLATGAAGMALTVLVAGFTAGGDSTWADLSVRLSALGNVVLFAVGFAPPPSLRSLWRRTEQPHVDEAVVRLMGAHTEEQVTQRVLEPMARIVGARAVALRCDDGRLIGSWSADSGGWDGTERRSTARPADDVLELRFAFGTLVVRSSPYAPYFGADERQALQFLGGLTDLALDRCALLASERRAREALQRSDELKNTFLSAVSHELRTPLTGILGYATLLQRRGDLDERRRAEFLGHVVDSARKLQRLLADLLDLDRLTRGNLRPQLRPTELADLTRAVAAEVDLDGHELLVDAEPVVIDVDPAKVERIVENLLINAVRHTEAGTRIWLRVHPVPGGARVTVADEGRGVPDDLKRAIFAPFHQGAQQRDHTKGTGIGLSLVAQFTALHGGRAWVEDREGGGAAFVVEFPSTAQSREGNGLPASATARRTSTAQSSAAPRTKNTRSETIATR